VLIVCAYIEYSKLHCLGDLVFFLTRFIGGSKLSAGSFTLAGDGAFLFLGSVVFIFSVFLFVGASSLVT
jgi:hypothetical protein